MFCALGRSSNPLAHSRGESQTFHIDTTNEKSSFLKHPGAIDSTPTTGIVGGERGGKDVRNGTLPAHSPPPAWRGEGVEAGVEGRGAKNLAAARASATRLP